MNSNNIRNNGIQGMEGIQGIQGIQGMQGIQVRAPAPCSRPDLDVFIAHDENHDIFAIYRPCITDAPMKHGAFVRPLTTHEATRKLNF